MKNKTLSHVDQSGDPTMVDVSEKKVTARTASARATVLVGKDIIEQIKDNELVTKKGPVFHTAIIAGVMGGKKTSEMIPFCHPLMLDDLKVKITHGENNIYIDTVAKTTGKTGVEMEALTAATIAALTIYDMCKALSHDIVIHDVKLMTKTGGKQDFERK